MNSAQTSDELRLPRRHMRGIVQIVVSVILLALVLRQIGWRELAAVLALMDGRWLGIAWTLFLVGVIVRAVRWRVLLNALGLRRPLRELVLWYFVGSFFNVLLPSGFGGDAVRVVELAQDTRQPGAAINSVVADRYLGLMVLLAMGLVAGFLRPDLAAASMTGLTAVLLFGGVLAAWLLSRSWWQRWAEANSLAGRVLRRSGLSAIAAALAQYGPTTTGKALAASLAFNLLQIGWNVAIGHGLGLHLPLALYVVVVPLTSVALLLPAFGGLGVRELTYVALLSGADVPQATALALSLGVYAITVATGLVGGVLYLLTGLRRARRKA